MYPIIRCPSCNDCLGVYHEVFQLLKNHKYEQELKKIMPKDTIEKSMADTNFISQVEINGLIEIDLMDIFEFLKIDRWCCRKILLTVSTFDEQLFAMPNLR
jgi:DNA-directed RNA polymerase subunit N (RpoN/RPB10)